MVFIAVTFVLSVELNVKLEQQEKDMEQQKRKHETFQALSDKHVSACHVTCMWPSCGVHVTDM